MERRWSRFLQPSARHQFTLPDHERASAPRGVPVYVPAFAGTHCAYPRRDGHAELTWVMAGYIPRWFTRLQTVTHPSTNRVRRWLTSLMRPTTLPTKPNRHRPSADIICSRPPTYSPTALRNTDLNRNHDLWPFELTLGTLVTHAPGTPIRVHVFAPFYFRVRCPYGNPTVVCHLVVVVGIMHRWPGRFLIWRRGAN